MLYRFSSLDTDVLASAEQGRQTDYTYNYPGEEVNDDVLNFLQIT